MVGWDKLSGCGSLRLVVGMWRWQGGVQGWQCVDVVVEKRLLVCPGCGRVSYCPCRSKYAKDGASKGSYANRRDRELPGQVKNLLEILMRPVNPSLPSRPVPLPASPVPSKPVPVRRWGSGPGGSLLLGGGLHVPRRRIPLLPGVEAVWV